MNKKLPFAAIVVAFAATVASAATTLDSTPRLVAALSFGTPTRSGDHQFTIPVVLSTDAGSANAQAFCFRLRFSTPLVSSSVQHSGFTEGQPTVFEWQSSTATAISYVVVYNERTIRFPSGLPVTFAEVTISLPDTATEAIHIDFDQSSMTMVSTEDGMLSATTAKGTLATNGVTIDPNAWYPESPKRRSSGH
jgi:hypothetical protein